MNIGSVGGFSVPTPATTGLSSIGSAATTGSAGSAAGGDDFFGAVSDALETVSDAHNRVDELAVDAATGDLTAVHELTMATAEAQLLTQLTVEVRNRAVEAFNDIMRMQV